MKLWGGRFAKETNEMVDEFNACIGFGSRLYEQDILGSIAHATMLGEQNIIPQEDAAKIVEGLKGILADAKAGKIQWSTEAEDIHMNVEGLAPDWTIPKEVLKKADYKQICLNCPNHRED